MTALIVGLLALIPSPKQHNTDTARPAAAETTVKCRTLLVGAKVKVPIRHCD